MQIALPAAPANRFKKLVSKIDRTQNDCDPFQTGLGDQDKQVLRNRVPMAKHPTNAEPP